MSGWDRLRTKAKVAQAVKGFYGQAGPPPDELYLGADIRVQCGAEQQFVEVAKTRGHGPIVRAGWPDFLVFTVEGRPIGVEVKSERDTLSKSQVRCFAGLEHAGLPVYVWVPEQPNVLTTWRKFLFEKRGGQLRGGKKCPAL